MATATDAVAVLEPGGRGAPGDTGELEALGAPRIAGGGAALGSPDRAGQGPEGRGSEVRQASSALIPPHGGTIPQLGGEADPLPGGTSVHASRPTLRRVVAMGTEPARRLPEGLLREIGRAVRAGIEGVVLSWLVVVVPVVAGYIATVASPVLGNAGWLDAARNGSALWLLGLGEPLAVHTPATLDVEAGTTFVTLVPLGLTLLTVWIVAGAVRRARLASPWSLIAVLVTALGCLLGVQAVADTGAGVGPLLGALGLLAIGIALGWLRSVGASARPRAAGEPWQWIGAGLRLAGRAGVAVLVLIALAAASAMLASAGEMVRLHGALDPDPLSSFLLVLAQLAAVPTILVWTLAWFAGPGFTIGSVSVTAAGATAGPLPVLPVLAAVPEAGPGPGRWVVVLLVLVVALAATRAMRRCRSLAEVGVTGGTAVLVLAAAGWALGALSGGDVGPLVGVGTTGMLGVALGAASALGIALAWGALAGGRLLAPWFARNVEPHVRSVLAPARRVRERASSLVSRGSRGARGSRGRGLRGRQSGAARPSGSSGSRRTADRSGDSDSSGPDRSPSALPEPGPASPSGLSIPSKEHA